VNIDLSAEALEFGSLARRALEAAGGDELLRSAESEPNQRERIIAPLLADLGAWDLEPRANRDELEAAAALCRSAGYWALAYPVAERLCRPAGLDTDGLVVVSDAAPAGAIAGLDLRWSAVTLDGRRSMVTGSPLLEPARVSAFVTPLALEPIDDGGGADVALGLLLPCWTLLGMLDRALDLVRGYVLERQQFGQPLAAFQGVQFQLTDAEVERTGLEELAKYALWSIESARPESLDDALAVRLAAIEAADAVFRVAHQLHGAIGFCDEATLSWISRYSAPLRRLPFGLSGTLHQLSLRLSPHGLSGIFGGGTSR
jgi:3-oxo-4-pregnene-20-carboxyl-CoA dehydrogenase alpha subunit